MALWFCLLNCIVHEYLPFNFSSSGYTCFGGSLKHKSNKGRPSQEKRDKQAIKGLFGLRKHFLFLILITNMSLFLLCFLFSKFCIGNSENNRKFFSLFPKQIF